MLDKKAVPRVTETLGKTPRVEREDFELACIREFAHSGLLLGFGVSPLERRERIRAAILRENKADMPWRNYDVTYADVFSQVYRERLEPDDHGAQRPARERFSFPTLMIQGEADDDEEEVTEAFEGDDGSPA